MRRTLATCVLMLWASAAAAQTVSQRGSIEGRAIAFPQTAPNDDTRLIGDALFREEVFVRPSSWLELAAGVDVRANSHDEVDDKWTLDWDDRSVRRPALALRRLTATLTKGPFTLDIGKQFIRWARADVLNPADRFAPRDFLNVVNTEMLPVIGIRPSIQLGSEIFEAVWVAQPTPSRLPLFDQRWTVLPSELTGLPVVDGGTRIPERSQQGARWRHVGDRFESSLSFFDGVNHLPNIAAEVRTDAVPGVGIVPVAVELSRDIPDLRSYGADLAIPTSLVTVKGEAAYFTSPHSTNDEYVLYVIELERQIGNWILDGGYAGEVVTEEREDFIFNPERGLAKSIVGHVAYTGDPGRTVAFEGAVRQDGGGLYLKTEYSEAIGEHWRVTATGIGIAGDEDDFLGQFHRNSSGSVALRFSF